MTWRYISFGVPDQLREISSEIWTRSGKRRRGLKNPVHAGMDDIAAQLDAMIVRKGARKFRLEDPITEARHL